jgi:hypothetical protein
VAQHVELMALGLICEQHPKVFHKNSWCESPQVLRWLQTLKRWSHEQEINKISPQVREGAVSLEQ